MIIDIHSHFFPLALIEEARKGNAFDGLTVIQDSDREMVWHRQGARYELKREFYDLGAKLARMDELKINITILSAAPTLFMYWADKSGANDFCRRMNDCLAEFASASGGRIIGLAGVPLQDPERAACELRRAIVELGFRGAQIGTSIDDLPLDDERFADFFSEANDLHLPLMIHPYAVGKRKRMEDFQLNNLVGNPMETCLSAARLILSGFLDRYPDLKFILPHGGGYLPYQIGRMDRGYLARPDKNLCVQAPSEYIKQFYFDTILFEPKSLNFLYDLVGAEHIMVGTDLPFDIADASFKKNVDEMKIQEDEKEKIFFRNAQNIFQINNF
jgi:aminocarboxymuconate-semialdehyde decarboxylase